MGGADDLQKNVTSKLNKYVIDQELQYTYDFAFRLLPIAF
jgi:hypothetical protein